MTTLAQEEGRLTYATAPMVSFKDYLRQNFEIIIKKIFAILFSGNTFKPENVVNNAVDKFGIPNCGRNQVCANILQDSRL